MKHASRFREGLNVVVLEPDVAALFKTTESVNDALREVAPHSTSICCVPDQPAANVSQSFALALSIDAK